jgi:hypothetical protein
LERQVLAEQGLVPPLLIYPEGCTTNGECIITFKRGSFSSLRAVKPFYRKVVSNTGISPVHGDSMNFLEYLALFVGHGWSEYTLYEMPVFEPNEYFW